MVIRGIKLKRKQPAAIELTDEITLLILDCTILLYRLEISNL